MAIHETLNILVLIPAYNEVQRIGEVVAQAQQYLPVLVVDDGSTDNTATVALQCGARVLSQRPNQGKGSALKAGFRQAIASGYAGVLTLDADGQHDPGEIPKFLQAYQERGADMIIGARDFSQIPLVRRAANTLGRWSFSWAVGRPVQDNQSGYRLVSRRLMEGMLVSQEQGFQFEVEMIVVCVQKGYALDWVPIRTIYAGESSHIQPVQHVVEFTRMVLQTRKRVKR